MTVENLASYSNASDNLLLNTSIPLGFGNGNKKNHLQLEKKVLVNASLHSIDNRKHIQQQLSSVTEKPVFMVSDQVRLKLP